MLYVINISFERVNAKFFRIVDGNALTAHLLSLTSLFKQVNFVLNVVLAGE